jgi:TatD DNase family protein
MLTDAHFHALDLERLEGASWAESYRALGILGTASCHSREEWLHADALRRGGLDLLVSLGVHPQLPVPDEEELIASLAASGGIDAVGECGFDLFPEYADSAAEQSARFDFQVGVAERSGLPLVIHARKALDRLYPLARRLAGLRSVVFHAWPGSAAEGLAFLKRGVNAYFSLGSSVAAGRKRSASSLLGLPRERILAETDAPYQPLPPRFRPSGSPRHSRVDDLPLVLSSLSGAAGIPALEFEGLVEENFRAAFKKR